MIGHIKSGQYLKNIARAILKKILPSLSQSAWNTRFYFGHQKLCMDKNISYFTKSVCTHELERAHTHDFTSGCMRLTNECIQTDIAR